MVSSIKSSPSKPNKDTNSVDSNYATISTIVSSENLSVSDTKTEKINNTNIDPEIASPKLLSESKRRLLVILALAYGNFCLGALYSLQAPFFPKEAEFKGATPFQYGLVFGIYEVGVVVLSPFVSRLMPRIAPRFLVTSGLLFAGIFCVLFGLLQWATGGFAFISFALLIRLCESIGGASFFTSSYTLIAINFPDKIAHLFATTEMFFGIGMIAGPAIGGFLYEIGNFSLPFFVMGALTLCGSLFTYCILPPSKKFAKAKKISFLTIISNGGIALNVFISVTAFFIIGFNDVTLEPFIRGFASIKPSAVGGIFLLSGLLYAVGNQVWAFVADKISNTHWICAAGFLLSTLAFVIVGPIHGIPIEPNLWLLITAQAINGLAIGGQLVGSFTEGLKETVKAGFPENISTYAMVSGLFSSGFSAGAALGPVVGGALVHRYGYRKSCYCVIFIEMMMMLLLLGFHCCKNVFNKGNLKLNPYSISSKSVDRTSGIWNEWKNNSTIAYIRIVRRNFV